MLINLLLGLATLVLCLFLQSLLVIGVSTATLMATFQDALKKTVQARHKFGVS
jgi:hypothetical protein